jgi:hypothetical protein
MGDWQGLSSFSLFGDGMANEFHHALLINWILIEKFNRIKKS